MSLEMKKFRSQQYPVTDKTITQLCRKIINKLKFLNNRNNKNNDFHIFQ
jgi:hypothetical protein